MRASGDSLQIADEIRALITQGAEEDRLSTTFEEEEGVECREDRY